MPAIDVMDTVVSGLAAPLAELFARTERSASGAAKRAMGFACASCHRVRHVSAAEPAAWNHLVTYLSGGMLYGSDVDKPEWFTPRRKRAYRPQTTRPAPRREQVRERLREGWTIREIAKELGVGVCAVHNHVKVLRAHEGVLTRPQLVGKVKPRGTALQAAHTG